MNEILKRKDDVNVFMYRITLQASLNAMEISIGGFNRCSNAMYSLEINGNGDPIEFQQFSKYLAKPCFQLYTSLGILLDELL